jgi:hypothetical protein
MQTNVSRAIARKPPKPRIGLTRVPADATYRALCVEVRVRTRCGDSRTHA